LLSKEKIMHTPLDLKSAQQGVVLIEVLVSIIIVVVGLLGLAGLQSRAAVAEMEAFQRAQAVVLVQDMVDRINANRKASAGYITLTPRGTGNAAVDCSGMNGSARDMCEWNSALLGAAESVGGLKVGAMIGARGCVTDLGTTMPRTYLISVVWQGLAPTKVPGATSCGAGEYGDDALARHGQPDGRAVLVDRQLVRHLALALVGEVPGELLVHVGQRVEEALLRLSRRERGVVAVRRLLIKEDRDDLRAGGVLEVRDHAAEDRGKPRVGFDRRADHRPIITRIAPRR